MMMVIPVLGVQPSNALPLQQLPLMHLIMVQQALSFIYFAFAFY